MEDRCKTCKKPMKRFFDWLKRKLGIYPRDPSIQTTITLVEEILTSTTPKHPSRIRWSTLLPGGKTLNLHIRDMILQEISDTDIIVSCVAYATHAGYDDTKALNSKIRSSIRSSRCKLVKNLKKS